MEEQSPETPEKAEGVLDIGKLLGRREAFGLVAGRCSAAEAGCLREIRETKSYKKLAPNWDEFCESHLRMSRSAADRAIRLLEELGPGYFELTQLVRLPPEAYRAIAPSVKDKAVHLDGEAIALVPENAVRVAAAVATLRRKAEPARPERASMRDKIAPLVRRSKEALAAFAELYQSGPSVPDTEELVSAVEELQVAFTRLKIRMR
jgi:hypothetical protein